jgi:general stress protein 26
MAEDQHGPDAARAELFERLDDIRAGMLGVDGSGRMRPMTHFVDEAAGVIRFVTSRKADLAAEVGQGATAHFCLMAEDFHAWISGTLSPSEDAAALDEIWSPVSAAWFTGRDDPDILLLVLPMREAEVWSSTDSMLHFGFEIARANLDPDHTPDVGTHDRIRF